MREQQEQGNMAEPRTPYEPVVPKALDEINFLDVELQNCPADLLPDTMTLKEQFPNAKVVSGTAFDDMACTATTSPHNMRKL